MTAAQRRTLSQVVLKNLGIDSYQEHILYLRSDSHIILSEGFTAQTRVEVRFRQKAIFATLNMVQSDLLSESEGALSLAAMKDLGAEAGDLISVQHMRPIESLSDVRSKMYHRKLDRNAYFRIMKDITAGLYSSIELSAFISACAGDNMDVEEITWLTQAMIESGSRLHWKQPMVVDKHCVGGLPGNRTTPIVVSIVAATGLTIPKTSSRAITSPAGTADTMEVMTTVDLSLETITRVVEQEHGCLIWGGSVRLSPADDILIAVERALDVDSAGQMIASVLSKKAAAGSTHVLIEIPAGPTAKVRTHEEALKLQYIFMAVGEAVGLKTEVLITDGSQPVGRGIGPALEAIDVLSVLRNRSDAPADLREKALKLAAAILEFSGKVGKGEGHSFASQILRSGMAYDKFMAICMAQGGFKEPRQARFKRHIRAEKAGVVSAVDNRRLSKVAKLAGAPADAAAGISFLTPVGSKVVKGQTLFTIHAESRGALEYTLQYLKQNNHIVAIEPA